MRIIVNVDEAKDANGKKSVRVRLGYYRNSSDCVRVSNCGVEIFNCLKEAFTSGDEGGWNGGIIEIEGERH